MEFTSRVILRVWRLEGSTSWSISDRPGALCSVVIRGRTDSSWSSLAGKIDDHFSLAERPRIGRSPDERVPALTRDVKRYPFSTLTRHSEFIETILLVAQGILTCHCSCQRRVSTVLPFRGQKVVEEETCAATLDTLVKE